MTTYRVSPINGAPVLRAGRGLAGAIARAVREFPAGVVSVEPVPIEELADMAAGGLMLPLSGRQAVAVFLAVRREKARALRAKERKQAETTAKRQAVKEATREARQVAQRAAREARAAERAKMKAAATRAARKATLTSVHVGIAATAAPVLPALQHLDDDAPWTEGAVPWSL